MLPTLIRRSGRSPWDDPFDFMRDNWARSVMRGVLEDEGVVGNYPVDIREDADHIYVDAEMPGFKKSEIEVTLENGVLTITASRERKKVDEQTAHLTERRFSRIARAFNLPNSVDESKVDAHLADGVLHLTLNKREEVKPRRIEVK